ncbi:MAG: glycosyltransferase [Vicinamibacterales bacterium]
MRDFVRAWRAFSARPWPERTRLIRQLAGHARAHGWRTALDRVRRQGTAIAATRDGYADWCAAHTPTAADLARMRTEADAFPYAPLVTIVTPVYNTDPRWLDACADSVLAQVYPRWQWSIGNDGSTNPGTLDALARIAARDPRIVVSHASANGGISAATNLALSRAEGEWVALMDSDDALLPHALFRMVEHLNRVDDPPDVVYSDEDKLDLDGSRTEAYFKPDWSPDLFLSNMYVCHLLMARRALVEAVGGFRTAFDFSQDYDLMLRLMEQARRIDHVPDILYHWRKLPQSGAMAGDAKPAAHVAGRRALQDYLDRRGVPGEVIDVGPPGFYRVRYGLTRVARVSLVAAGVPAEEARALAAGLPQVRVVAGEAPPEGDHVLVLGRRLTPVDATWLDALLEVAEQPGVGVVAPRILDAEGRILDIGLVLGGEGVASRPLAGWPAHHGGYFGSAIAIRNVAAVSGSCWLTPAAVWAELGGIDRTLSADAAAVDYALRARKAGYRVIVTPWSTLQAAGTEPGWRLAPAEVAALRARWGAELDRDPFHNPHRAVHGLDSPIG